MFDLFIGAAVTACATYFIEVCMRPGMIFERYYNWLVDFHASLQPGYLMTDPLDIKEGLAARSFWFKPMGGCSTCMNVWLCFFTFPASVIYFGISVNWWLVLLFLGYIFVSNAILRKCLTD